MNLRILLIVLIILAAVVMKNTSDERNVWPRVDRKVSQSGLPSLLADSEENKPRNRRTSCDVLTYPLPFGYASHAACASFCFVNGKNFHGHCEFGAVFAWITTEDFMRMKMSCLKVLLWLCLWEAFANGFPVSGSVIEKELECYSQEKIYDKATDKCYKLLTSGPCPRGHWFVLEKPKETLRGNSAAAIRGVCVRERCKDGEYFWSTTNSCVKAKDKNRICGNVPGQELLTNVFGEGECACARNPPRARLSGDRRQQCYLLYTQGPCHTAQVLGFQGSSEQATCIPDPCYAETLYRRKNRTLSKDAVLASWENGTCYELGTQGPCPEGLIFKVHSSHMKPACASLTNSLFQLEKSRNCFEDEEGRCQKAIRFSKNQTAVNYRKELFKRFIGARRRRTTKRFQKNVETEIKWVWRNR